MPENPYLPDKGQQLAMLLMSLGGGISQSAANGTGVLGGVGPGIAGYAGALGQAKAQQEAAALRRWQMGLQEREIRSKEEDRNAARNAAASWTPPGMSAPGGVPSVPGMTAPPQRPRMGPDGLTGDTLDRSANAISGIESGGRYDAVGPIANQKGNRAYGKYQVMDFNVGPWTQEVLGQAMTPQQFVASPQAQDAVYKAKFGQYVQKYGSPEAASRAWFGGEGGMNNPNAADVNGMTVQGYGQKFAQAYGDGATGGGPSLPPSPNRPTGSMIAQGGGEGTVVPAPPPAPPQVPRPQLPEADAARLKALVNSRTLTPQQGEQEAHRIVNEMWKSQQTQANQVWQQQNEQYRFDRSEAAKSEQWYTLGKDDVPMYPNLDPSKAYQRNRKTGEIKPIGAPMVNIDQKGETEFAKEVGKNDAKRLNTIQENTSTVLDTVAKIRAANDLLTQTYTGPGAEYANAWYRTLGSLGVETAKNKADAATAAQALIAELTPRMRVPGSGATSDFEMQTFGKSLVSLMNTPGGNEKIANYWERIAERQVAIQGLAERYATENKGLTGTKFAEEVKALGPLFSKDEIEEMKTAAKGVKPAADRPPLAAFGNSTQNMTPMPQRPPLSSFGGR